MAYDTNTAERAGAYDMIDRFLRNNLSSDEDYAEYSKALDLVLGASLAASAGSEPVAWRDPSNMCDDQSFTLSRERAKKWPHIYKQPLYTHPSPPEGMAGWKPIETAPKDGTEILLRSARGRVADGAWGQPDGWANPNCWVWPYINQEPTHWMPLPASEAKEL